MRAVYEIYDCDVGGVVDRVSLNVDGDPYDYAVCYDAIEAAHLDPGSRCRGFGNLRYEARFAGYADPTVEVPVVLIKQLVAIVKTYQQVTTDSPRRRTPTMNAVVTVVGQMTDLPDYPE